MGIKSVIWMVLILGLIMCPIASALNVSFASVDGSAERDVYMYSSSGVLLGLYNTTSTGITVSNDTIFMFKPQTSDPLENPSTWLTGTAFPWVRTNALALFVIAGLIAIVFWRR